MVGGNTRSSLGGFGGCCSSIGNVTGYDDDSGDGYSGGGGCDDV